MIKSVLLAVVLFVVSTTLAGPCPRLACGFLEPPPICSNPSNMCSCRCNNTTALPPSPPISHPSPSRPGPCGSGRGPTQAAPSTIGSNRVFAACPTRLCPCGEKLTCLSKRGFGGGCDCKCIKLSANCTMPWGPYACTHACDSCMCRCVAPPPFKPPPPTCCQPIQG
uniref:Uncharacterized protein n=1 Tax=Rhipicephalus zambeziensis TaxID=60191 RepID=A0A224YEU0_9ACAR